MKIAIQKAKPVRPNIKLGICGEHGGDPETIEFCHKIGLTYVSCSPFRVPIARLAAAQAAVKDKKRETDEAFKKAMAKSLEEIKKKYGKTVNVEDLEKEIMKTTSGKSAGYSTA